MNFQPISIGIELLEVMFEPVSIADRNLIRQASVVSHSEFCFPTGCRSSRLLKICVRQHGAHASHLCVKLTSVHDRPVIVRYQEHWPPCLLLY